MEDRTPAPAVKGPCPNHLDDVTINNYNNLYNNNLSGGINEL